MLNEADQALYSSFDKSVIYPVPNKWGKQGATYVELKKVKASLLKPMPMAAYEKAIAGMGSK